MRNNSYAPWIGAVNVSHAPSAFGMSRTASPIVTSLFMPEPGIRSCSADRLRPPSALASEPLAAKSQMSLRDPAPAGNRLPSAAMVFPSGSHVGRSKADFGPAVTAVTFRDATSTVNRSDRKTRSWSRCRFAENAIRVPSGDHAGEWSVVAPSVSRVASPLVASTSQRCPTWSYVKPSPLSM